MNNTRELLGEIIKNIGAQRLANALRKMGIRCRPAFVYSQAYEQLTTRRNWYETAKSWLEAIMSEDLASFEVIWNDLDLARRGWYRKYHGKLEFPNALETELMKFNNRMDLILQG